MLGRSVWLGQVPLAGRRRLGNTQAMTDADSGLIGTVQAAVVEFSSNGCVPCMQYKPVFDDVASQTPSGIMMASVNIDESPSLASLYNIEATPTTIFLATGTEVNRVQGKMTKDDLLAAIAQAFPTPSQPAAPAPAPQQTTPASSTSAPSSTSAAPAPQAPAAAPPRTPAAAKPGAAAPASSGMSSTTKALVIGGVSLTAIVIGVVLLKG